MYKVGECVPDSYKKQDGCYNCKFSFAKHEYDEEAKYYCRRDGSKRPLCGSVLQGEHLFEDLEAIERKEEDTRFMEFHYGKNKFEACYIGDEWGSLEDAHVFRLTEIWDSWEEKHWVDKQGTCEHWGSPNVMGFRVIEHFGNGFSLFYDDIKDVLWLGFYYAENDKRRYYILHSTSFSNLKSGLDSQFDLVTYFNRNSIYTDNEFNLIFKILEDDVISKIPILQDKTINDVFRSSNPYVNEQFNEFDKLEVLKNTFIKFARINLK